MSEAMRDAKGKQETKGTVERIIPSAVGEEEKAQISIHEAEGLYREIRVPNEWNERRERPSAAGVEVDVSLETTVSDAKMQMPDGIGGSAGQVEGQPAETIRSTPPSPSSEDGAKPPVKAKESGRRT